MGKINNISESWKGHSFEDVETFVKEEFNGLAERLNKITPVSLNPEFNKSWENNEYLNVESAIKNGLKTIKKGLDVAYGNYAIPFTIEATQDGTTVYFRQSSHAADAGFNPLKVEVSTNGGETWAEVTAAPAEDDVPGAILAELDKGEKVLIRGRNEAYGFNDQENAGDIVDNCNFYADKPCYVYGNIMSLVGGDDFARLREVKEYAFAYFFSDYADEFDWCWVLSKEEEELLLPATTLASNCYTNMFWRCIDLVAAPKLPATTLADSCYYGMFSGCTNLATAPELPAITLANRCYQNMFGSCTGLTTAPELPATTLAKSCYYNMFYGCTSLVNAPALLAKTLEIGCYNAMFQNCTSLNYIKAMFTTTPGNSYTSNWVNGVKATGTFVKNASATWNVSGVNGIPSNWTVETASE